MHRTAQGRGAIFLLTPCMPFNSLSLNWPPLSSPFSPNSLSLEAMKQDLVPRRYALLLAAKDSDYVLERYDGYLNVFTDAFGDPGEVVWDLFRVVEGEFPQEDQLGEYDGFIVSGSPHDAYGDDLWILRLCLLLQTLDAMHKRVLGVCFGHQVLCRALGGHVVKAPGGWEVGIKEVTFAEGLLQHCPFMEDLQELPRHASIIQCHQDEVWVPPLDAKVIAFSKKTAVEAFCIEDHILGIQGHPEYTKDILDNLIGRLAHNNIIDTEFAEEARKTMETAEPDREFWEMMCKRFLKGSKERLSGPD